MARAKLSAIPILEGKRLVGVLCNCQITERVVAKGLDAAQTTVRDLMDTDPVRISDDRDIETAALVMRTRGARVLAVQDCFGRFIGLLTELQLCRFEHSRRTETRL
jgi:predicted transcriptional regulator